jgi:hypothetical protein
VFHFSLYRISLYHFTPLEKYDGTRKNLMGRVKIHGTRKNLMGRVKIYGTRKSAWEA